MAGSTELLAPISGMNPNRITCPAGGIPLQTHFPDDLSRLCTSRKGTPGVLGELVERLLLKCRSHCAGLPDNQQRQLVRKHHFVGG